MAAGACLQAGAADLGAIKRAIDKEPAYREAPKYCLLVFGKEAATHIWMILDGKTLYVDRNGNGDLTEPGERLAGAHGTYFHIARIVERDGTVHENLRVNGREKGTFTVTLGREDRREQFVGIGKMEKPTWGDKAETAPIIHFNGPMALERYGPVLTLPRMTANSESRRYKLQLMVGTPGLGKGTFASYDDICTENLGPIQADIEYPNLGPSGEPIRRRVELIHDG